METLTLTLPKRLDHATVSTLWTNYFQQLNTQKPTRLTLDAHALTNCNSAGMALLYTLQEHQQNAGHTSEIIGLSQHLKKLMAMQPPHPMNIEKSLPDHETHVKVRVRKLSHNIYKNCCEQITFIGMITCHLLKFCRRPQTMRWQDFWKAIEDVGPKALPIAILIGFLVGLITSFQSAIPLGRFGAQIYIADLVGIGLIKEMGPLMTAVLLAGRTASSFAAEIGTMKINQEIDALTTMGLDPVCFLTVPRILATLLMTPILNIFLVACGLIACGIVMHTLGFNVHLYIQQLKHAITISALIGGTIKAMVFGLTIASIGCLHGLKTRMGASAVGYSTTQAVVASIILIVIIDGIFAGLFYVFGI